MSDDEEVVEKVDVDLNEGAYEFPLDKIKDMKVFSEEEKEVEFGSLISGKKCVNLFIKLMDKYKDELKAAGIDQDKNVLIIGCGAASWIKRYREDVKIPYPVYTDTKRVLHQALALIRVNGLSELTQGATSQYTGSGLTGMAWSAKVAIQAGRIETGDSYQQGASFVLDEKGKAHFHYFEKYPNDHPVIEDIFIAAGAKIEKKDKGKGDKDKKEK